LDRIHALLQVAVDALGRWCRKWRIELNPEKSAAVLFSQRPGYAALTARVGVLSLFGRTIPWETHVRYLGVLLDRQLTLAKHIKTVRDRAVFYLTRLSHLLRPGSSLSVRNKLLLYKSCIRPVFSYASVAFAHCAKTHLGRLQTLQKKFLRRTVNAPGYVRNVRLHADLFMPSVHKHFKEI
jgi:hypothetical protein